MQSGCLAGAPTALPALAPSWAVAEAYWNALPHNFEVLLFVLAFITRYYGLTYPDSIVFDEIHFGGFVRDYDIGT